MADAISKKSDVVISTGGSQSNHCRALAGACARLGGKIDCHLILRMDDTNKRTREEYGKEVVLYICVYMYM